jgi:yecA family protein
VSKDTAPPDEFSQEDYDRLSELLDLHSPLDLNGVLGLLHAVAVSPSVIPDEAWLPMVLNGNHALGDTALARYCIELLVRLKVEVQDAVDHSQTITPDSDEVDECRVFAAGYVAGAELDPQWIGDANRWTFASGIAYLAERLDVVPQHTLEKLEQNLAPHPRKILRDQMSSVIHAAAESFKNARVGGPREDASVSVAEKTTYAQNRSATGDWGPIPVPLPIGRNDPCPCGSGRKFKRCCMS